MRKAAGIWAKLGLPFLDSAEDSSLQNLRQPAFPPSGWSGGGCRSTCSCPACKAWALNHDHDRCLEHNATVGRKGRKIEFRGPVHLPPVRDAFESLELRQRTGYWRGKPGRAADTGPKVVDLPTPRQRRAERLAR